MWSPACRRGRPPTLPQRHQWTRPATRRAPISRAPASRPPVTAPAPAVRTEPAARTAAPAVREDVGAIDTGANRRSSLARWTEPARRQQPRCGPGQRPAWVRQARSPAPGTGRQRRRAAARSRAASRTAATSRTGADASGVRWREPAGSTPPQKPAPARRRAVAMPAVHQVLATLGYGDAIGNEVLGIQRVLRAAGYESEIFVETADLRLEDLTIDYRELPDASHPDNLLLHHFSLGSRASRAGLCPARSDGADLPQHHATRVLHRRAPAAGAALLPRPPRTRAVCQPLRDRAWRLRVQPAGARGPRLSQDRRAAGGARLLSPVRTGQLHAGRPVRRRAG